MGGERGGERRRGLSRAIFMEAHNKDMEMKHLYATLGLSLCSQSGPTTSRLVSALRLPLRIEREHAEMNESNNPTVRREGEQWGGS